MLWFRQYAKELFADRLHQSISQWTTVQMLVAFFIAVAITFIGKHSEQVLLYVPCTVQSLERQETILTE